MPKSKEKILNPKMTIPQLVKRCNDVAESCGWNESEISVPEQVALIHSEVSEALESFRNKEPLSWASANLRPEYDAPDKPQGLASEYADVVIRVAHYCARLGIDLEYEIDRKLKYNLTRGYKHGGKQC